MPVELRLKDPVMVPLIALLHLQIRVTATSSMTFKSHFRHRHHRMAVRIFMHIHDSRRSTPNFIVLIVPSECCSTYKRLRLLLLYYSFFPSFLFYFIFLTHVLIALHFSRFHIYYINNWPSRRCHWMSSLFSRSFIWRIGELVFFPLFLFSCLPPISMKINYCVTSSTVAICFWPCHDGEKLFGKCCCDSVSNVAQTEKKQKENEHTLLQQQ